MQESLKPCVPDAELSSGICAQKGHLSHCCFSSEINSSAEGSTEKSQLKAYYHQKQGRLPYSPGL